MTSMNKIYGSFRDPSGYVFEEGGKILRTVTDYYKKDYDLLVGSGLAQSLSDKGWLIPFRQVERSIEGAAAVLEVDRLAMVSYPYEWSFKQLKDAAVLTLSIQREAMKFGMTLKDASAYNVQFHRGKPVFIDIQSFEAYKEGTPWVAYKQYVSHFLAPLLLMNKVDLRYGVTLRNFLDGFPIDFVSKTLSWKTYFSPALLIHIHAHARMIRKYESTKGGSNKKATMGKIAKKSVENLVTSLLDTVRNLKNPCAATEWGDYYNDTNYTDKSFAEKKRLIAEIYSELAPKRATDLGANTGEFSRVMAQHSGFVLAADIDPVAVNANYTQVRKNKETNVYPLLQDLCNPSPGIGWRNAERQSFVERAKCDVVSGLALIHHLCIGNNLPFCYVAELFRELAPVAVLEFVPKGDSQVDRLFSAREDIFPEYDLDHCKETFLKFYGQCREFPISGTCRTLLLFTP